MFHRFLTGCQQQTLPARWISLLFTGGCRWSSPEPRQFAPLAVTGSVYHGAVTSNIRYHLSCLGEFSAKTPGKTSEVRAIFSVRVSHLVPLVPQGVSSTTLSSQHVSFSDACLSGASCYGSRQWVPLHPSWHTPPFGCCCLDSFPSLADQILILVWQVASTAQSLARRTLQR